MTRGILRLGRVFFSAALLVALPGAVAADGGAAHQVRQARPVALGISGGSVNDSSSAYCCGGTLGALVEDGTGQYVLSNNHVLAQANRGSAGDPAIQPGLIDQTPVCSPDTTDTVAQLSAYVPIQFAHGRSLPLNVVDAAIARVVPGAVRSDGAIQDIGAVSANTVVPFMGQIVQKSGRTTGHTFGQVAAVDVTVDVGYSKDCGSQAINVARFINQIRIVNGTFSAGGDSGSLIVEADAVDPGDGLPRAVGLLFAGSSTSTLANPINPVLSALGVSMVGGAPLAPPPTGAIAGVVTAAADGSPIGGATVSAGTGQSTTTGPDGTYTLADVPTGDRQVTAAATGFESQSVTVTVSENATVQQDFALNEAIAPTQAIVECITYDGSGGPQGDKHLSFSTSVVDDFGNPVSGAEVQIVVTLNGSTFGVGTGAITNSAGVATYEAKNAPTGTYETTVTAVIASGLTFEGSTPANLYRKGIDSLPDSDCRGDAAQPSGAPATGPSHRGLEHAKAVKRRNEARLFGVHGVVGAGIGRGAGRQAVIEVYLSEDLPASRALIPPTLEDVPTRVVVTGAFTAY